jgi:hypothetical protein
LARAARIRSRGAWRSRAEGFSVASHHYVSANGVEDYRQKTPQNIVEIARVLLRPVSMINRIANNHIPGRVADESRGSSN